MENLGEIDAIKEGLGALSDILWTENLRPESLGANK